MMGERFEAQNKHRRSIRLKGYDYRQAGGYFVTICAWQRECLFGEVVEGEVRLNEVGRMVAGAWRRLGEGFANVQLGAFVVMPNHVHGIIFIHGAERATRTGQNLIMEEECRLPDEAMEEIVGSPVHMDGANVGATHPALVEQISGTLLDLNIATSGTDGSPRRGQADPPDNTINPASPHRGQADPPDMEIDALDWDSNRPAGATRYGQNMIMQGNGRLPDEAMEEIVGSPLHTPGPNVRATHPSLSMPNSGTLLDLNIAASGTDGSPLRGQADAPDMEIDAGDGDSDGPGRATRSGENLIMDRDGRGQDQAAIEMGGSPVRGAKGPLAESLGAMVGQWKSRVTKRAWKLAGMSGRPIWLRNYYEHIIRDEADLRRIEEYIRNNPRRWEQDQLHPQAAPNQFNQDRSHGD
jgi:REP element-mobilizing transposase RayT